MIPRLAEHYTVVAPDLLGHGRSDKPHADYSVAAHANGMRDPSPGHTIPRRCDGQQAGAFAPDRA